MDQNLDKEQLKKQVELERMLNLAKGFRSRGDYGQAEELITKALQLAPNNLDVREFAADILFARGELEKAAEHYKELFTPEKPRPSAEEKYAKAIIEIAEGKRQRELLNKMLENPRQFRHGGMNPYVAAMISIAPGFGHIYAGLFKKGLSLFLGSVLCWTMVFLTMPPTDITRNAQQRAVGFALGLGNFPTVIFVLIALGIGVYSIIDAVSVLEKRKKKEMANKTISDGSGGSI